MRFRKRVSDMPKVARRLGAVGLALVIAIGVVWAVRAAEDEGPGPEPSGPTRAREGGDTGGMAMGGMAMGGDGSVRLTAAQIREFGVTFGSVELRRIDERVRTVGIVGFDETRMSSVTPKFGGYVERLYVDFTGQPVRRGQALAEIYSPELVAAQEELLLAARLEDDLGRSVVPGIPAGSSNLVAAARRRLQLWDISDAQIDEILETGRAGRTLTLHARASGIVVEKDVLAGQAVQAGQQLYAIADMSVVWVQAELREVDAGLIEEGDEVTIELAAFPGGVIGGRVEYVYPTLQSASRTVTARISVPNPDGRLKPGMYATVRLDARGRAALSVPLSAILDTGERRLVFVDMGDGRLTPYEVETGRIGQGFAEVLAGLEPGQRVVTSAQYLLDSESNLAETMRSMIGMGLQGADAAMDGMDMPPEEP